ncbi:MAG: RNA-directed DNA polymerase [Prevotella sp.]|nr:RNA-directed DNA polymerase [Prevotella sp.]
MSTKTKNILSLNHEEALDFFMKSEQFHGFELPEYFDFDVVLNHVKKTIGDKPYEECLTDMSPDNIPDVNLDILLNKDGHYAVRPLILANPFLYYFLAREMCCPSGWEAIQRCFKAYAVPHLTSCALPVIVEKVEEFYKSTTILNWWNTMEQRSIELSLEYRYMFVTDITNCYGSINPQSIEWALLCKNTKHENNDNISLALNVQKYLRALQHGHNIGIPQGSALFDFVAEIILGYSDLLLSEALQKEKMKGYEIIRYRDDYRVFCDDKDTLERISFILQSVLEGLNFRMNSQKTKISDSIVTDAIKPDKLFYIYNTPVFNKKGTDFDSFEKHLLFILMYGRQYPNSGQLKTLLSDIDKRIEKWLKPYEVEVELVDLIEGKTVKKKEKRQRLLTGGSVRAMSAVATQIALDNVTVSHYALRVISRMVDSLKDMKEKRDIIDKVYTKLCKQHNSDYNQLWLQNITYTQDKKRKKSPYTIRLCKLVMGNMDAPLWNNSWMKPELVENIPYDSIVNKETLKKVTPVIVFRETRAYNEQYYVSIEEWE